MTEFLLLYAAVVIIIFVVIFGLLLNDGSSVGTNKSAKDIRTGRIRNLNELINQYKEEDKK